MQIFQLRTVLIFILIHLIYVNDTKKPKNYCAHTCGKGNDTRNNYLCDHAKPDCVKKCDRDPQAKFTELSDANREFLLTVHNDYRQRVASGKETRGGLGGIKISNMQSLSWSKQAEKIASCIAATCPTYQKRKTQYCIYLNDGSTCSTNSVYFTIHNSTNKREIEKIKDEGPTNTTEQKLFIDEVKLKDAMNEWYKEVDLCGCNFEEYTYDHPTKNFNQMVWAESNRMGCGFMGYTDKKEQELGLFTCVYCPSGRIEGEAVFLIGDAGPNCGKDSRFSELCSGIYDYQEPVVDSALNIKPMNILCHFTIVIILWSLLKL